MTNAELIAKIKAEIERRFIEYNKDSNHHLQAAEDAELLSFLDTLESEKEQPDFPTTNDQVKEFLATHPKVELPEKYQTPDWIFEKSEKPNNHYKERDAEVILNGHGLLVDVTRYGDGYKLKVIIKEESI